MSKRKPDNMMLFHIQNAGVDYNDARSVSAKILCTKAEENNFKLEEALRRFSIGLTYIKNTSSLTYEEFRKMIGFAKIELDNCIKVVKLFNQDEEKFSESFIAAGYPSWRHFADTIAYEIQGLTKPKDPRPRFSNVEDCIKYIRSVKPEDEKFPEHLEQIKLLRSSIDRFIPGLAQLDSNFLRFHECCCCGTYPPPPEGFNLRMKGGYPEYPICPSCEEHALSPDGVRVANMYKVYSLNMEEAYESLTNII